MTENEILEAEFLKESFSTPSYFPDGYILEEQSEEVKSAWRDIFAAAYQLNREGRHYTPLNIKQATELNCIAIPGLTLDKVEKVFKKVFEQNKDEFGIANKPDIVKVECYLNKKYDFAFNEVLQVSEYRPKFSKSWSPINNNSIFRDLQHVGFKFPLDRLKSLLKSDFVPKYDPFKDHFENLPEWDKSVDHIDKLAGYVKTNDQDFFKTQFKKMLVRSVKCGLYGIENRFVFVLVGEAQEVGKSSFIRFLNPFGRDYYTEAPIRPGRDFDISLAENFLYNMEELQSLNNTETNRVKSIISAWLVKERKAYAESATALIRRCNFWASTNKKEFLTDTLNTRWLCFEVNFIDWNYKKDVDISQVWAQAFALSKDPDFSDQLTKEEAAYRDDKNKSYEVSDLEKDLIKKSFAATLKGEGSFYSNADIFNILQEGTRAKLDARNIGRNMKQLNFEPDSKKINNHTVRGWWVKYIPPTSENSYEKEEDKLPF